jgi:DNA polymerase III subunit beta
MKIECNKTNLSKVITKSERVVNKNISLPVLSCLLFEAKNNEVFVKSTNLEIGLKIKLSAKVIKEGEVAVPAGVFVSYINNLPIDENITIEVKDNVMTVSGSRSETKINILPSDDFPNIPDTSRQKSCKLSSKELLEGFKSVWYAASVSSMKPELSSVFVHSENGEIVFVATDSFRLAEKKIKVKTDAFESILIPQKNVLEIIRIFEDTEEEIKLFFEEDKIAFETEGGIYLVSRVVDGVFPDYKQIIPKENKTDVIVLKNDLVNTFKISNIFSNNFNQINFLINNESGIFEVSSKSAEKGESRNTIDGKITGESLEINFNQKYIQDSFNSIEKESVNLYFNGPSKPMVIKGVGEGSFQYLVMPLNK